MLCEIGNVQVVEKRDALWLNWHITEFRVGKYIWENIMIFYICLIFSIFSRTAKFQ